MSPALNGSLAIRRFEHSDAIEIRDGITLDFYTGLPHMYITCSNQLISFCTHTHTHTHTHTQETYVVSPSSPQMGQEQFQKQAEVIFKEYFDHGNTQEVADSLAEWNHKNYKHEVHLH